MSSAAASISEADYAIQRDDFRHQIGSVQPRLSTWTIRSRSSSDTHQPHGICTRRCKIVRFRHRARKRFEDGVKMVGATGVSMPSHHSRLTVSQRRPNHLSIACTASRPIWLAPRRSPAQYPLCRLMLDRNNARYRGIFQ